jgi:hypothetical protein
MCGATIEVPDQMRRRMRNAASTSSLNVGVLKDVEEPNSTLFKQLRRVAPADGANKPAPTPIRICQFVPRGGTLAGFSPESRMSGRVWRRLPQLPPSLDATWDSRRRTKLCQSHDQDHRNEEG